MLKHIWFDMAGTLYKETPEFRATHDELRYTTYARLAGQSDPAKAKEEYEELYAQYGSNSALFRSLGQPSDFWMRAFEEMDVTTLLKPDSVVIKALTSLKEQLPISIFTNFKREKVIVLLEHLQIPASLFTHILTGDDVPERKPDLAGFRKMIKLSKVPASEIMYVGDRLDVDIKPARQLGMKTCLIYGESDEADYSVQSFGEIKEMAVSN